MPLFVPYILRNGAPRAVAFAAFLVNRFSSPRGLPDVLEPSVTEDTYAPAIPFLPAPSPATPIPSSPLPAIPLMPTSQHILPTIHPICRSDLFRWAICELDQPAPPTTYSPIFAREEIHRPGGFYFPRTLVPSVWLPPLDHWPLRDGLSAADCRLFLALLPIVIALLVIAALSTPGRNHSTSQPVDSPPLGSAGLSTPDHSLDGSLNGVTSSEESLPMPSPVPTTFPTPQSFTPRSLQQANLVPGSATPPASSSARAPSTSSLHRYARLPVGLKNSKSFPKPSKPLPSSTPATASSPMRAPLASSSTPPSTRPSSNLKNSKSLPKAPKPSCSYAIATASSSTQAPSPSSSTPPSTRPSSGLQLPTVPLKPAPDHPLQEPWTPSLPTIPSASGMHDLRPPTESSEEPLELEEDKNGPVPASGGDIGDGAEESATGSGVPRGRGSPGPVPATLAARTFTHRILRFQATPTNPPAPWPQGGQSRLRSKTNNVGGVHSSSQAGVSRPRKSSTPGS
ncbi:hypothetical protein OF83DRAFT_638364 [Amylostereum chailletii]|nr:hypothetical protein OF83DRAFT_638364 [Amylostereum chailletii]